MLVSRAINQGTLLRNPFPDYVKNKAEWKYQNISGTELELLIITQIHSKSTCFVRDMFVFSCFTGLAYAEMRNLSENHLYKASDGSIWICISRQKTGVESNIRLLDIAVKIIDKYRFMRKDEYLFKMPKSTHISYHLRKIEKLCSINHLHFHMARHTFATLICMSNGVPLETISKMMGHRSMRTTQIYAEITNQKVAEDMKKLAKRIEQKKAEQP
jgi:integrase